MFRRRNMNLLRATPQYIRLTDKQKAWIEEFISNGEDPLKATMIVHKNKCKKNAEIHSQQIVASRRIIQVLDLYTHPQTDPSKMALRDYAAPGSPHRSKRLPPDTPREPNGRRQRNRDKNRIHVDPLSEFGD